MRAVGLSGGGSLFVVCSSIDDVPAHYSEFEAAGIPMSNLKRLSAADSRAQPAHGDVNQSLPHRVKRLCGTGLRRGGTRIGSVPSCRGLPDRRVR